MKIRDIVNRDLVNLTNCESEPIHIPGSIQPHGFLLGIRKADHMIDYCSGNIFSFTGLKHEQLLGKHINVLIDDPDFLEKIYQVNLQPDVPAEVFMANGNYECKYHASGEMIILELEPKDDQVFSNAELYAQTKQFITYIENSTTLQNLCQSTADEIRSITGYDRVMIYRFDEQYNGEVFAESCNDNIEPFLGLHYPHTDIPPQARELYIKNLLRLIVDVNYSPVPVYTLDDKPGKNLDMSYCDLRSVSPIHIQYLQNMGVGATLTISLIHEKKLWGLVACHHYGPKFLSNQLRISARLQGHFLTSQIQVRESWEEYNLAKELDASLQKLMAEITALRREDFYDLLMSAQMLDICNASGIALLVDDKIYASGIVPDEQDVKSLMLHLEKKESHGIFFTNHLASSAPEFDALSSKAAGVAFYALGSGNAICWFRSETITEVKWAGDPDKAILKDDKGLHPRKSFTLWKEIIKGKSRPWLKPELNAATLFAQAFQRQLNFLLLEEEEEKYRALSNRLQEANSELENINWISAHDLKEPLRKIQVLASKILDTPDQVTGKVANSVDRMRNAAARMQLLITDILNYSKLLKTHQEFEMVNLNFILAEVAEELKEEIADKKGTVTIGQLPVVNGIPFLVRQMFVNLLHNALKFSRADIPAQINIDCKPDAVDAVEPSLIPGTLYYEISVTDNGIGFKDKYNESIFNIFSRLNSKDKYSGSGIGLAICKKIMQNHAGAITASAGENTGATFKIYFPVP